MVNPNWMRERVKTSITSFSFWVRWPSSAEGSVQLDYGVPFATQRLDFLDLGRIQLLLRFQHLVITGDTLDIALRRKFYRRRQCSDLLHLVNIHIGKIL